MQYLLLFINRNVDFCSTYITQWRDNMSFKFYIMRNRGVCFRHSNNSVEEIKWSWDLRVTLDNRLCSIIGIIATSIVVKCRLVFVKAISILIWYNVLRSTHSKEVKVLLLTCIAALGDYVSLPLIIVLLCWCLCLRLCLVAHILRIGSKVGE